MSGSTAAEGSGVVLEVVICVQSSSGAVVIPGLTGNPGTFVGAGGAESTSDSQFALAGQSQIPVCLLKCSPGAHWNISGRPHRHA